MSQSRSARSSRPTIKSLQEQLRQERNESLMLEERLGVLELQLEDIGWQRQIAQGDMEFSREGLDRLMQLARLAFMKNPLIRRGTEISKHYVFGQGLEITSEDERTQALIDEVWFDPKNQRAFTSDTQLMESEVNLAVKGNEFLVVFADAAPPQIRRVRAEEIRTIICNPDDASEPWWYKRCYYEQPISASGAVMPDVYREVYYEAVTLPDSERRPAIDGKPIAEGRMYHVAVGHLEDMRFGVPEIYPAIDWARSHTQFLEDCATVMRALSRFATKITRKGSTREQLEATRRRMETTLGAQPGFSEDRNPPPVTGSTFIGTDNTTYEPVKVQGATISPSDGRQFRLQVAAALGIPETMFGDVDVGNFATSKTLDRPTELRFVARQSLWRSAIQDILAFIVEQRLRIPQAQVSINVDFPPILEPDKAGEIGSLVQVNSTGRVPGETISRMMMSVLGIKDIQDQLDKLEAEQAEEPSPETEEQLRATLAQANEVLRRMQEAVK